MKALLVAGLCLMIGHSAYAQIGHPQVVVAHDNCKEKRDQAVAEHAEFDSNTGNAYAKLQEAENTIIGFVVQNYIDPNDASIMFDDLLALIATYRNALAANELAHADEFPDSEMNSGQTTWQDAWNFWAMGDYYNAWNHFGSAMANFERSIGQESYILTAETIGGQAEQVLIAVNEEIAVWYEALYAGVPYP